MYYTDFKGLKLSKLGFGTMRLPLLPDGKTIDQQQVQAMTDYAMAHGINYFDTAYPYHDGNSEIAIGKALSKYPRESYFLADKYPGHQIASSYDPAGVFERQLKKCGVDYFDFYLLHNVNEYCLDVYKDKKWGIIDYFAEQRRLGRIRHLGFSCHGGIKMLDEFTEYAKDVVEFCQIQLNYLDWTLQDAKTKVELLNRKGLGIWVMEPVRGGKLAHPGRAAEELLSKHIPESDPAQAAFRFLQGVPGVNMILSGMSDMEQMKKNVATFDRQWLLTDEQTAAMMDTAEMLKDAVPCTACRYCCAGCPMGLDIPGLIAMYNDMRYDPSFNLTMRIDAMPGDKRPSACIGCGQCSRACPQKINVPEIMADFAKRLDEAVKWEDICRQREAAAKAMEAAEKNE